MDLGLQAYHYVFGCDPDEDMAMHADDIEAWRVDWQRAYAAGEEWALATVTRKEETTWTTIAASSTPHPMLTDRSSFGSRMSQSRLGWLAVALSPE